MAGLGLDPWQELVLEGALRYRADGKWAASDVGLVAPRQNGKNGDTEARELAGLFLLDEPLVIHTAHKFDTAREAFRRLRDIIDGCLDLRGELHPRRGVTTANGTEGMELRSGQRIRYRARTGAGGRGFSEAACLIFDEAMDFEESSHGSLFFTGAAHPNPQRWYVGSAVDKHRHPRGLVLTRLRARALAGGAESLAYFEWAADGDLYDLGQVLRDRGQWAQANPALGIRISHETVSRELEAMDPRTFATERLGIGDWPALDALEGEEAVVPEATWQALLDQAPVVEGRPVFALDVQPGFRSAAIGACKARPDGGRHVEVIDHRDGTGWAVDRLVDLQDKHDPVSVLVGEKSPAAALIEDLKRRGVRVRPVKLGELTQACGLFDRLVEQGTLRHGGPAGADPALSVALAGARVKTAGDAWYWSRSSSAVDISPLVAVTLAAWGLDGGAAPAASVEDYRITQI